MRIKRKKSTILEGDLTPMIDMTFQLIAFFMVLINFTQADQNKKIKLPESVLAKPPEEPLENAITLQMYQDGNVYFDGNDYTLDNLRRQLVVQRQIFDEFRKEEGGAKNTTVIVRGDGRAQTGKIQEMIKLAQEVGFEKFALRAKEDIN